MTCKSSAFEAALQTHCGTQVDGWLCGRSGELKGERTKVDARRIEGDAHAAAFTQRAVELGVVCLHVGGAQRLEGTLGDDGGRDAAEAETDVIDDGGRSAHVLEREAQ